MWEGIIAIVFNVSLCPDQHQYPTLFRASDPEAVYVLMLGEGADAAQAFLVFESEALPCKSVMHAMDMVMKATHVCWCSFAWQALRMSSVSWRNSCLYQMQTLHFSL